MSVPDDVMNACVSLFSGAGIGDLGIHYGCGIETIVAVEKEEDRADLIRANYPKTEVMQVKDRNMTQKIGYLFLHSRLQDLSNLNMCFLKM
jgi:site-specific DNA-cytosine methylase